MDLDLRAYVRVFRKRKWIVVGALVLCLASGALYTSRQTPRYQASATLFVGESQITTSQIQTGLAVTNLSNQLLKSYAQIITSRSTITAAIAAAGLPVGPGQVRGGLSATPLLGTFIFQLTYVGTDAALAQQIVNAVADA